MADLEKGYKCEFTDPVSDDYRCKECLLVARRLSIVSCCCESYCKACIDRLQEHHKPCPNCGELDFTTLEHVKYQRKIAALQVYCSMKERGCDWSGTLQDLHPHKGDCQYTEIDCPLTCDNKLMKKNVDDHVAKECVQREYTCPYCSYKATYKMVSEKHWPECSYYPLPCPNQCGVTCERDTMEDHLNICPLQEVECPFSSAGCEAKFPREEEEKHMKENSEKHLTMMAAASVKMSQLFHDKLEEQERKYEEKLQEQEKKFEDVQEKKSEDKLQEQEKKFEDKLQEQKKNFEETLQEQEKKSEDKLLEQEKKFEDKLQEQKKNFEETLQEQEKKSEDKLQEQEKKFEDKLQEQKKNFEETLQEQEKKSEDKLLEQEKKFEDNIQEQEKKFEDNLQEQEKKFEDKLQEQEEGFKEELQQVKNQNIQLEKKLTQQITLLDKIKGMLFLNHQFTMENFSMEKRRDVSDWKSQAMYTHVGGYKFCIGIDASGYKTSHGNSVTVELWSRKGEFDDQLKWPVTCDITIELINHYEGGENWRVTRKITWRRPTEVYEYQKPFEVGSRKHSFIQHSELKRNNSKRTHFLVNDCLHFKITEIVVC